MVLIAAAGLLGCGVAGGWSVRDIIAHVTSWEQEALTYLPLILAGGKPPRYSVTYGGIDAFNAQTTEQKRNLSLSEVLLQRDDTHRQLIDFIQSAPEDQFIRETRFRRRLRLDTYSHYPIHAEALKAFDEEPERWIDVTWDIDEDDPQRFPAKIVVTALNEPGSLAQIATVIGEVDETRWPNRVLLSRLALPVLPRPILAAARTPLIPIALAVLPITG